MKTLHQLLVSLLLTLGLAGTGSAQVTKPITVYVDGMVCSFCAQGLIKTFKEEAGVQRVQASLENKSVTLQVDERTHLTDAAITKIVKDAGYEVSRIERVKGSE